VIFATFTPTAELAPLAAEAEALGFDGISFPDHVFYPLDYESPYPYTPDNRAPWNEEMEWPDPFVACAAMASATTRIRLLTAVLVLPLRHPLFVAKALGTLDALAPGRLVLGIGGGWLKEEFDVLGADWSKRGRAMNEAIEVLRKVWAGKPVAHDGPHYPFPQLTVRPVPERPIPIHVGGSSEAALNRAARLGDGFMPPLTSQAETKRLLADVHRRREEAGRGDLPFEVISWGGECKTPADVEQLAALGIDTFRVNPLAGATSLDERRRALERFAQNFIEPLAASAC
jgi:probable F420-dependent oxidoreductase